MQQVCLKLCLFRGSQLFWWPTPCYELVCDICGYKATTANLLTLHKENRHEGVVYGCDICQLKTITKNFLTVYRQVQHEGKRMNCSHCDYKAKSRWKLNMNFQRKQENVTYSCTECDHKTTKQVLENYTKASNVMIANMLQLSHAIWSITLNQNIIVKNKQPLEHKILKKSVVKLLGGC